MTHSRIVHVMMTLWNEEGKIHHEVHLEEVQKCKELLLDLPKNTRPTDDWFEEALENAVDHDFLMFLPNIGEGETLEICEEPIYYEAIGEFEIEAHSTLCSGEYYEYEEAYSFIVHSWSCDIYNQEEE